MSSGSELVVSAGRISSEGRTSLSWRSVPLATETQRGAARASLEHATRGRVLGAMAFDLDWKAGPQNDWSRLVLMANDTSDYALFLQQDRPLPLYLGEKTWLSLPLVRYTTVGSLLVGPGQADVSGLLAALAQQLPRDAAIACEGLALDDPVLRQLETDSRCLAHYIPLRLGPPFPHHVADLPESVDAYLKTLSTRSREGILRSERKLNASAKVELRCYTRPEDVDDFLQHGSAVSRLSYQWRLLDLGLRDDAETRASLLQAAEHGWLRSYLLWVNDKPVAFMLGLQYRSTYDYTDVGFDPEWAQASVGTVLQIKVMRHLYECVELERPSCFDFSTGHGAHKARFGNRSREEVNLLLMPRSTGGKIKRAAYLANEAGVGALTRGLERWGLKDRLKKLMRARAGGE